MNSCDCVVTASSAHVGDSKFIPLVRAQVVGDLGSASTALARPDPAIASAMLQEQQVRQDCMVDISATRFVAVRIMCNVPAAVQHFAQPARLRLSQTHQELCILCECWAGLLMLLDQRHRSLVVLCLRNIQDPAQTN